jgi:hypothetical protein
MRIICRALLVVFATASLLSTFFLQSVWSDEAPPPTTASDFSLGAKVIDPDGKEVGELADILLLPRSGMSVAVLLLPNLKYPIAIPLNYLENTKGKLLIKLSSADLSTIRTQLVVTHGRIFSKKFGVLQDNIGMYVTPPVPADEIAGDSGGRNLNEFWRDRLDSFGKTLKD